MSHKMKILINILIIGGIVASTCFVTRTYAKPVKTDMIVLAGGCFWGVEGVFEHVKGVQTVISGYAGGKADNAQYEAVSAGNTDHAESVEITYDPTQVSLEQLLDVYFLVAHNPTELNYQGPDHGTQYRSAIFYETAQQKKIVAEKISALNAQKKFDAKIVTKLEPLTQFYPAEDYHQNYLAQHPHQPYIMMYDAPKITALKQIFPNLYTEK